MITGRRLVRILLFSGGTLGVLLLLLLACGNSVATGQWLTLGELGQKHGCYDQYSYQEILFMLPLLSM